MNNLRLIHPAFRRSSSSDEDSPTRRPAGHNNPPPPPSVKRALFGPTDHEENRRFVSQELKRHSDEAANRWNFDFETCRPRKGRFAWKEETTLLLVGGGADGPPSGIAAAGSSGGILVRRPSAYMAFPPPIETEENRENVAVGGAPRISSLSAAGFSSASSSMLMSSSSSSFLLAGSPAGCLEDLRTPAPSLPPAATERIAAASGEERTAGESSAAAAARLSETSSRGEEQGGARPKTKEQKITDAFKSRKPRSKSSSRLRSLKRLDGPRPVASRSPSVKSRGGGSHRSPPATSGRVAAVISGGAGPTTDPCNSD